MAGLLIVPAVLVVAGGILASLSLLTHFGVLGARSGGTTAVVRGGTWTQDIFIEPDSLLPNGAGTPFAPMVDNALYLPLFYGDAQGVIHPGAASEVPTLGNEGISADATTWTFHLRPHLVWSDGQPYDARDVDYTWQLWRNPAFGASNTLGLNLITQAYVSADHLSITFHLKHPFAPFLSYWVDGFLAPLPAHHFSALAPQAIKKSPDNLNPTVTSGPFLLSEYVPGDHFTLVRNPHYYLASQGLPYLDKVVFRFADMDTILQDLQAGTITSVWFLDQQALIQGALHGLGTPLCTDHGSFYHPGYETNAPCSEFNVTAANKLLADKGWVRGPDGVRAKGGQRLEFEYSTTANNAWRSATEAVAGSYDIAEFENTWYYDPDDSSLLCCDQIPPNGYNVTFYCNPALDALYRQELATADKGVRQQLFGQIHQIYLYVIRHDNIFVKCDIRKTLG
jgi:peptide/nickel transport system substrate-binding protein